MNFTIRDYCRETDLEALYQAYSDLAWKTTGHMLSGTCPVISLERFESKLDGLCHSARFPFVVADKSTGDVIGIALIGQYYRVSCHYEVTVNVWKQPELTEAVLKTVLDTVFAKPHVKMVIIKVAGYKKELLDGCRHLGMTQVGCIPDYVCYGEEKAELYPEYTFMMKQSF